MSGAGGEHSLNVNNSRRGMRRTGSYETESRNHAGEN
ncbi:MAG: hypothetical protein ACI8P0_001028 [Planctomycetaceae bacterium]|jgi:hypothetical protein